MENVILINVGVPYIEQDYNIFIPVNLKINMIKKIVMQSIIELTNGTFVAKNNMELYNKDTNHKYENNIYVVETDIRNGTKLILL